AAQLAVGQDEILRLVALQPLLLMPLEIGGVVARGGEAELLIEGEGRGGRAGHARGIRERIAVDVAGIECHRQLVLAVGHVLIVADSGMMSLSCPFAMVQSCRPLHTGVGLGILTLKLAPVVTMPSVTAICTVNGPK